LTQLIRSEAPPRPACFDTQQQWVDFLVTSHTSGAKVVRRTDVGKHAGNRKTAFKVLPVGQQSHCKECAKSRRERMEGEGRCFPVRPPERAQAKQPELPAKHAARSSRFEIDSIATLQSVRVKRGHDEDRTLAVVLGVKFPKVDAGICAYFDELLCTFLYRQTLGGRIVRNEALRPVSYAHQLKDALVEIDRASFPRADVGQFVVSPIDGTSVSLDCRVTLYPGRANFSQLLGRYREGVRLRIVGAPDLFDEPEPESCKPQAQHALI
jgi:hypothetical protein